MTIILENQFLKAAFAPKGAELQLLSHKQTQVAYLWDGNENYWAKFSPVLFPIVGALKNNTYQFEGKYYMLPRHGFARDMVFETEKISEQEVLFTLLHNQNTLKIYPFEFKLALRYKLTEASLTCSYEVFNPANTPLLFSVGAHPAFAVPLNKVGSYTNYFLKFNKDQALVCHQITNNLIANKTTTLKLDNGKLKLKKALFYNDALVIKTLKSDCISILNTKNNNGLHFSFSGFPYFGIWAAKNANFVCLEPWCGIADAENATGKLDEKEGIISLAPKTQWLRSWRVSCF